MKISNSFPPISNRPIGTSAAREAADANQPANPVPTERSFSWGRCFVPSCLRQQQITDSPYGPTPSPVAANTGVPEDSSTSDHAAATTTESPASLVNESDMARQASIRSTLEESQSSEALAPFAASDIPGSRSQYDQGNPVKSRISPPPPPDTRPKKSILKQPENNQFAQVPAEVMQTILRNLSPEVLRNVRLSGIPELAKNANQVMPYIVGDSGSQLVEALNLFPNPERLKLNTAPADDPYPKDVLEHLPKSLKELNLSGLGRGLTRAEQQALQELPKLTTLRLEQYPVNTDESRELVELINTLKLTTLSLNKCSLTDPQTVALADALKSNNTPSDDRLESKTFITHLSLDNNNLRSRHLKVLADIPNLKVFNANHCDISNRGARALARGTSPIIELNLGDNQIGAEGARALAEKADLVSLRLKGNPLYAQGAEAIGSAMNPSLTCVDVSDTKILFGPDVYAPHANQHRIYTKFRLNPDGTTTGSHLPVRSQDHAIDISTDGIKALLNCPITELKLTHNSIHDDVALIIATKLKERGSQRPLTLDLSRNFIDIAAPALVKNAIGQIKLSSNSITKETSTAIRRIRLRHTLLLGNNPCDKTLVQTPR